MNENPFLFRGGRENLAVHGSGQGLFLSRASGVCIDFFEAAIYVSGR